MRIWLQVGLVVGLATLSPAQIQPNQIDTTHGLQLDCVNYSALGVEISGTVKCCTDCLHTRPCTPGGNGARAFRDFVGVWQCGIAPTTTTSSTTSSTSSSNSTSSSTSTSVSTSTSTSDTVSTSTSTSTSVTTSSSTTSSVAPATTSTTSTSSSTSSTTTTSPDFADFLVLPDYVGTDGSTALGTNTFFCARVVPRLSIQNATTLGTGFSGSATARVCGIGVYTDSDSGSSTTIAKGSTSCPSAAGKIKISGLTNFSLTSGTPVRICVCHSGGSQGFLGVASTPATGSRALLNMFTPTVGTAATVCTVGVPPDHTGVISAVNTGTLLEPVIVVGK